MEVKSNPNIYYCNLEVYNEDPIEKGSNCNRRQRRKKNKNQQLLTRCTCTQIQIRFQHKTN